MFKSHYRTVPEQTTGMPGGIPYIVGNEGAERFSFYGMRAILTIFMAKYIRDATGNLAPMPEADARQYFHLFVSAVYFTPLFGAIIADAFLGKYLTIVSLSIVYCLGHLALAIDDTRIGLAVGLTLISIGAGGIKPCVSAHVGDQFGSANKNLIQKAFAWFYFAINAGSLVSTLLTPWVLEHYGPHWAFGIPGLLMLLATWVFWLGRWKFAHIPPGGKNFLRETFSPVGMRSLKGLIPIYLFVAVFWSLYDQSSSAWVLQADKMNLHFAGLNWLPSQIQAANPALVLIYIPLFTYLIYPAIDKVFPLTALRKVSIGFFVTAASFLIPAWVEMQIGHGAKPSIGWHFIAYLLLIAGEIFVSITFLEFSYTQAPRTMKSFVMALFWLSVSVGNLFTSAVNHFINNPDGTSKLPGASYYMFFVGLMLFTAVVFVFVAMAYKEHTYIQGETEPAKA
jgi:proton-dependent oligopeptide transporter, POT family